MWPLGCVPSPLWCSVSLQTKETRTDTLAHRPPAAARPDSWAEVLSEFERFAKDYRQICPDTVHKHRTYLDRFHAHFQSPSPRELFPALSLRTVEQFVLDYAGGHGPGSRRSMQLALCTFLRFAHHRGYLSTDLTPAVPTVRQRRLLPLADSTIQALRTDLQHRQTLGFTAPTDPFLISRFGRRFRYDTVNRTFGQLVQRGGIAPHSPKPPRLHDLRHTFATRCLLNFYQQGHDINANTRNQRLAAIKTFFRFLAREDPRLGEQTDRICAIQRKATEDRVIRPLMADQVQAMISATAPDTLWGRGIRRSCSCSITPVPASKSSWTSTCPIFGSTPQPRSC